MSHGGLLRMYRGDTKTFAVTVTDVDDYGAEAAVDITGYSLRFTAKRVWSDTDDEAVIVKTTEYGGIALGTGTGEATITIDPEDTEDLVKTTRLVWDIQAVNAGVVTTLDDGQLLIKADISRTAP